jgi:hypothetical protein
MSNEVRKLREKIREAYKQINREFYEVMNKMDKTLEALEDR